MESAEIKSNLEIWARTLSVRLDRIVVTQHAQTVNGTAAISFMSGHNPRYNTVTSFRINIVRNGRPTRMILQTMVHELTHLILWQQELKEDDFFRGHNHDAHFYATMQAAKDLLTEARVWPQNYVGQFEPA